jgi:beta-lactam-binding protein with PASTA domain
VVADTDPVQRKKRHVRREFWGAVLAFFGLCLALAALVGLFAGAYFLWIRGTPKEVTVPAYVGLTQDAAQQALAAKDLNLKIGRSVYNTRYPAGTVLDGDPPAGKMVRANRDVTVTISQGRQPVTVPDFSEMSLKQARQVAALSGLRLGLIKYRYDDSQPDGYVLGQDPGSGVSIQPTSPIQLVVSRGPQSAPTAATPTATSLNPDNADTDDTPPLRGEDAPAPSVVPNGEPQVTRAVKVTVTVPSDGGDQEVSIVVSDANGENTVYSRTRPAGDVVTKTVHITRNQGDTALVRVYVGDTLVKQLKV